MSTGNKLKEEKDLKLSVKRINERFRIYPNNLHSKEKIGEKLEVLNVDHFIYCKKATTIRRVFVRGFPADWPEDSILEKLKKLGWITVDWLKVSRLIFFIYICIYSFICFIVICLAMF